MGRLSLALLIAALFAVPVAAQNFIANGDFENGLTGWTLVSFNDPLGTTGVRLADVNGTGDATQAIYADFQTLTPVMSAFYNGTTFTAPQGTYPVSAAVSFEKQVTTPIPSVTANRVEFRLYDANVSPAVLVKTVNQYAPNQTGLVERVLFQNATFSIPATGNYYFGLFLRHSNLAGIPFIAHVDDFAFGEFGATINSGGSASLGNVLNLLLFAPSAASKPYFVGSALGTGPIVIGARKIDLGLDGLLVLSTSGVLPAIFDSYNGFLDTAGKATAKLNLPKDLGLVGIKVHSAFVTTDSAAPSGILTISNTCAVTIQK
ncbi:MAG: hypothetical protein JXQ29_05310 [Planctomycetes bacterium]|nr:hypothetical protein [Planctomycetota bacterium]